MRGTPKVVAFVANSVYHGHMSDCDVDPFLTTSQAARFLEVSRQHVANLCDRGELACYRVGRHRRIRKSEAERFVTVRDGAIDRSHLLMLWLSRAVAAHIARDPSLLSAGAQEIDARWDNDISARFWFVRWRKVIASGPESAMQVLTALDPESLSMQNMSPFLCLLPMDERNQVVAAMESYWPASQIEPPR